MKFANREEKEEFYCKHILRYEKKIRARLGSRFKDEEMVSDKTQDVLEKAWKNLESLRGKRATWDFLEGILLSEIARHEKKQRKRAESLGEALTEKRKYEEKSAEYEPICEILDRRLDMLVLLEAISRLASEEEKIIKMYLRGFSKKEIAKITGYGERQVNKKIIGIKKKFSEFNNT